jgi:large subunit ribosomal protein L25
MSEVTLEARRREPGRSNARVLRRQSIVPGIYYFHGEEPIAISVAELALRPLIFTTESHLVKLRLDDGVEKACVLKDISFDPITDRPTHFDLQGVSANEAMNVEVPVVLVGQAIGTRNGGVVDFSLHKLEIECLPANLPEQIEVDITNLNVNDTFHVSDLKLENITILTPADLSIVSITPARVAMEETATITEPEVISKGKADDK